VRQTTGILLLLATSGLAAWCAGPETIIQKRVSEVRLTLVATDQNDRPVETLSPSDITVLEDGQPVSRFELRTAADLRLRIAIVIDLSDSTRKSWATVRTALGNSLQDVMRPDDEVVVLAFDFKDMPRAQQVLARLRQLQPNNPEVTKLADEVTRRGGSA